jgi:hypothetical protein
MSHALGVGLVVLLASGIVDEGPSVVVVGLSTALLLGGGAWNLAGGWLWMGVGTLLGF